MHTHEKHWYYIVFELQQTFLFRFFVYDNSLYNGRIVSGVFQVPLDNNSIAATRTEKIHFQVALIKKETEMIKI